MATLQCQSYPAPAAPGSLASATNPMTPGSGNNYSFTVNRRVEVVELLNMSGGSPDGMTAPQVQHMDNTDTKGSAFMDLQQPSSNPYMRGAYGQHYSSEGYGSPGAMVPSSRGVGGGSLGYPFSMNTMGHHPQSYGSNNPFSMNPYQSPPLSLRDGMYKYKLESLSVSNDPFHGR